MNQIAKFHNPTMSSLEIAEMVESRHDKVKQSIERLAKRGVIQLPPMGEVKNNQSLSPNSYLSVYCFAGEQGKRDSYVVVAQLSPEFTARLVDRWQELEQQVAQPYQLPKSMSEALRLAADQAEQIEQQQALIEQAKPAVEYVERYVSAESGNKGFRQVAKLLKANERDLRAFLRDEKIMYQLGGEWMPYQNHIDAGRFVVKTGVAENDHAYNTAKFTPKGINWLAGVWAQYQLGGAA